MKAVLDTSAVLAWLREEPGAEVAYPLLSTAVMSTANWSETWQKLHQHGVDADRATNRLRALGVRVVPLTEADAVTAANLWYRTRAAGLSLGDFVAPAGGVPHTAQRPVRARRDPLEDESVVFREVQ